MPKKMFTPEQIVTKLRQIEAAVTNGQKASIVIGQWHYHYNHHRPHNALGYRLPASLATVDQRSQFVRDKRANRRMHSAHPNWAPEACLLLSNVERPDGQRIQS
jgi:predicted metallo-beta-lactamase superfamily hydrolase